MADDFEFMMKKLEEISEKMDDDTLSMSKRVTLYKEGAIMAQKCLDSLNETEQEISDISAEIENMMKEDDEFRDRGNSEK